MAQPQKILLAYDGSAHSKEALTWAIDLSLQFGAALVAVKVMEPDVSHRSGAMFQEGYGVTLHERFIEMRKMDEKQMAKELKRLEKEMMQAAQNLEFEKAAQLRDQLKALREKAFGHE